MMERVLLLLVLFFHMSTFAQEEVVLNSDNVDKKPEFKGGTDGFEMFLAAYFNMPDSSDFKGGKVVSSFIVDKEGILSDIKILEDPGFGAGDEIRRLLNICQKWIPAELNGQKVKVKHVFPIEINLARSKEVVEYLSTLETFPSFPGGMQKFYEFIGQNFKIPEESASGKIIVKFVVDTDGSLADINVLRHLGQGTADEAIRVLKKSPKWMPGKKGGRAVRAAFVLPISIQEPVQDYRTPQHNRSEFYLKGRSKNDKLYRY